MLTTGISILRRSVHLRLSRDFTTRNPLPATFLRGGTSKGIYINRHELPPDVDDWAPIFHGIMGSPDSSGRQLNGMGGGISSLSKICVVGKTTQPADVEYTFAQVGIRDSTIDYAGNCGNLSHMIGVYAVDEGLATATTSTGGTATVRAYNTNTRKIIDTTFPVSNGVPVLDNPDLPISGLIQKGSAITMEFVDPAGARTGTLLPSNSPSDTLSLRSATIRASLVDATNPTIFIDATEMRPTAIHDDITHEDVEHLRQEGARKMGLDPTAQAQPKIAFIRPAGEGIDADIEIQAFSMGVLHKAVPMTVALCLGVAANVSGTIANLMMVKTRSDGLVRIKHPGGIVSVGATTGEDGSVKSAKVLGTGRRLMKGLVWW